MRKIKKISWFFFIAIYIAIISALIFTILKTNSRIFNEIKNSTLEYSYKNAYIYIEKDYSKVYLKKIDYVIETLISFELIPEEKYYDDDLGKTFKFYTLSENLRFSFIEDDFNNRIILQYTDNEGQRYLSNISGAWFLEAIENLSQPNIPTISLGHARIYLDNGIITYFDNLGTFTTIYDEINFDKKEKKLNFLSKHYPEEFIVNQNANLELIYESELESVDFMKINLYSLSCTTCEVIPMWSDVGEIVTEDGISYMFKMPIYLKNSNKVKGE